MIYFHTFLRPEIQDRSVRRVVPSEAVKGYLPSVWGQAEPPLRLSVAFHRWGLPLGHTPSPLSISFSAIDATPVWDDLISRPLP